MRTFQSTYRDRKTGATRKTARWYIEIRLDGRPRRVPGFTDRKATEALGRTIEALARCKAGGERPDAGLVKWIEGLPRRLRDVLQRIGLLDGCRAAALEPLLAHLDGVTDAEGRVALVGFRQALAAKGASAAYADLVAGRARRVIEDCGFVFLTDVSASKVMAYLEGLRADVTDARGTVKRGLSAQTSNFHLAALKQFCRWMVRDGRASESPVAHLDGLNVRTDRRHDRRALTVDEVRRLLAATAAGPERFGMTGAARALLYRVAVETGLRRGELASLTRASFDLDGPAPEVRVAAGYSKHRRQDVLPLRPDTAALLRAFLAGKTPAAPAFNVPEHRLSAKMMKADLEAAGIDYRDDAGLVADFHALRHTAGTLLAATGVHPKVAQSLMRHSTIDLTMSRYSHVLVGQEASAVAGLPDLAAPPAEAARATGTAGPEPEAARLALCLALQGGKGRTSAHHGAPPSANMAIPETRGNPRKSAGFRGKSGQMQICGEVPERLIGPVSKTGVALRGYRGFESPPLRHSFSSFRKFLS